MPKKTERILQSLIAPVDGPLSNDLSSVDDPRLEPAFLTHYRGSLFVDARGWRTQAKAFYAHAITRRPADLKLHVQRIALYAETVDPEISGALLDLFLVLGEMGTALRRRMLALAKPQLQSGEYGLFRRLLERDGPTLPPPQPTMKNSVLSRGITGNTRLIEKGESAPRHESDPLEEARQQVEFGQVELALATLETALMADPARLEIHHALLEIYRHARQRERVADMLQRLQGSANPALPEWRLLLSQLDQDRDSTEKKDTDERP